MALESEIQTEKYKNHIPKLTWSGRVEQTFGAHNLTYLSNKVQKGRVLEIGSSVGVTTQELVDIFGPDTQVIGIDIDFPSEDEANVLKNRFSQISRKIQSSFVASENKPIFVQASGYFPPFAENSFNVIFSMNNLYFLLENFSLSKDQLKTILSNIWKTLMPGGYFCISGSGMGFQPYCIFQLNENKKASLFVQEDYSSLVPDEYEYLPAVDVFRQVTTALQELDLLDE